MQYVILAVVFSKGAPYRQPMSSNWSLLGSVVAIIIFTLYLIICPNQWVQDQFELILPPANDFRLLVVILCFVNFCLAVFHEYFICDYLIFQKLRARRKIEGKGLKKYLSVERNLCSSYNWPPIGNQPPMQTDLEDARPPKSPATITIYSTHNSVFNFPPPGTRASNIYLDSFITKDDEDFKGGNNVQNVSTFPRQTMFQDIKKKLKNNSCHSVVQVHHSEDSLSTYQTPPESFSSRSIEIELDEKM
uniref:Cation-transporting P-type ATPase C-terminal domain-containing protein n=2 Tax=Clastoptera arizonana TaxID=38151 RepID=A0A1B6CRE9_9HEMI